MNTEQAIEQIQQIQRYADLVIEKGGLRCQLYPSDFPALELAIDSLRAQQERESKTATEICAEEARFVAERQQGYREGYKKGYDDAQAERENPKPLTVKQMEAIREPTRLWIVDLWGAMESHYELVEWETICVCPLTKKMHCISLDGGDGFITLESYGKTWIAYDHEPKGGQQ
jgi:hypothetical protein